MACDPIDIFISIYYECQKEGITKRINYFSYSLLHAQSNKNPEHVLV